MEDTRSGEKVALVGVAAWAAGTGVVLNGVEGRVESERNIFAGEGFLSGEGGNTGSLSRTADCMGGRHNRRR